jgi:hypothetical protein
MPGREKENPGARKKIHDVNNPTGRSHHSRLGSGNNLVVADWMLKCTKDLSTTDPWPSATSPILRMVSIGRPNDLFL